jgi:rhodanese-related sulfurtransferase
LDFSKGEIELNISDLFTRVDKLSVDQARDLMDKKGENGPLLLDVREPSEYEAGHIPGARFIPLSNLLNSVGTLDQSGSIITYCKRGPRSRSAAALLKREGFDSVSYMDGGIDAWNGLVASGEYEAGLLLLEDRESPDEMIALAWSLEDGTGTFYSRMKEIVYNQDARDVFESLITAEDRHKTALLEAYQSAAGTALTDAAIREKSLKGYMEGGVSIEDTVHAIQKGSGNLADILEISMQIEANSLDLYLKMRAEIDNETVKKVMSHLIEEEKAHLSRLGKLLDSTNTINE